MNKKGKNRSECRFGLGKASTRSNCSRLEFRIFISVVLVSLLSSFQLGVEPRDHGNASNRKQWQQHQQQILNESTREKSQSVGNETTSKRGCRSLHFIKSSIKSSLQSLSRAAQRGATTWSDHVVSSPFPTRSPVPSRHGVAKGERSNNAKNEFRKRGDKRDLSSSASSTLSSSRLSTLSDLSNRFLKYSLEKESEEDEKRLHQQNTDTEDPQQFTTLTKTNDESNSDKIATKNKDSSNAAQQSHNQGPKTIKADDPLDEQIESNPPNHFLQETIAYIAGGAAASSAFAAVSAGAIFATGIVAIGAVVSAVLNERFGDEDEGYFDLEAEGYWGGEDRVGSGFHNKNQIVNEVNTFIEEDCDYDADLVVGSLEEKLKAVLKDEVDSERMSRLIEHEIQRVNGLLDSVKLDKSTLDELEKCFHGRQDLTQRGFPEHHHLIDVCSAENSEDEENIHKLIMDHEKRLGCLASKYSNESLDAPANTEEDLNRVHLIHNGHSMNTGATPQSQKEEDVTEPIQKRVEVVWHDAYTNAANTYFYTKLQSTDENSPKQFPDREKTRSFERLPKSQLQSRKRKLADSQKSSAHWAIPTDAERDGALLLSESFRVASSAVGLVADAVRFTGETAAAAAGGTARLAGGAVKVGGWAVGSLGTAIEKGGSTSDQLELESTNTSFSDSEQGGSRASSKKRLRKVAGSSVRLIGDAIDQVADSLLSTGSASERLAFAAAGAAEGTVRIVEELASSLSDMFAREGRRGLSESVPHAQLPERDAPDEDNVGPTKVTPLGFSNSRGGLAKYTDKGEDEEIREVFQDEEFARFSAIAAWLLRNSEFIMGDTMGIASLAPEMLGVLLICYIASLLLLSPNVPKEPRSNHGQKQNKVAFQISSGKKKSGVAKRNGEEQTNRSGDDVNRKDPQSKVTSKHKFVTTEHAITDDDSHSTLTADSTMKTDFDYHQIDAGEEKEAPEPSTIPKRVFDNFLFVGLIPVKISRFIFISLWNLLFNKKTASLLIHCAGWGFLCFVSQHRSFSIQRKSEMFGYKKAVDSAGKSFSIVESTLWLNAILSQLWRLKSLTGETYGGLEPLISSSIESSLVERLEDSYSKPSGIAHVSLVSFTLGSSSPIIQNVEIKGVDDINAVVYMGVDVGLMLPDATLLLDIKPSSLEYTMLPSTKVSIDSLDAQISLDVYLQGSPEYPYVSSVNCSLNEIPAFNLKIVPQSESGFKGVDFGSFPVVSKWIKDVVNAALAEYLSPQYLSIDIPGWIKGDAGEEGVFRYFKGRT